MEPDNDIQVIGTSFIDVDIRAEYLQWSLAYRSAHSNVTYTHKVYAQCSLNTKEAVITTLGEISPLEGYAVHRADIS